MKKLALILSFLGIFCAAFGQNKSYVYLELDKKVDVDISCNNYPIKYDNNGYVILHNLPTGENTIKIKPKNLTLGHTFVVNVEDGKSYGYRLLKSSPNEYLLQDVLSKEVVKNSAKFNDEIVAKNNPQKFENKGPGNTIKVINSEQPRSEKRTPKRGVLEVLTADNQKPVENTVSTEGSGQRNTVKDLVSKNRSNKTSENSVKKVVTKDVGTNTGAGRSTYAMYHDGHDRKVQHKNYRKITREKKRIARLSQTKTVSTPKVKSPKTKKVTTPKVSKTKKVKTPKIPKTREVSTPKDSKLKEQKAKLAREQKIIAEQEQTRLAKEKAAAEKIRRESERREARATKEREQKARVAAEKIRARELRSKEREAQESIKARQKLMEQERLAKEEKKRSLQLKKEAARVQKEKAVEAKKLAVQEQTANRELSRKEKKAKRNKSEQDFDKYVDGIGKKVINPEPTTRESAKTTTSSKIDPKNYISSECPRIPLNSDVKRMVLGMQQKLDDEAKVNYFLKNSGTSCYTAPQIAYVMKNLDSQIWKYKLAKEMRSKVADPEHMDYITKLFNNSFKKKFDKLAN